MRLADVLARSCLYVLATVASVGPFARRATDRPYRRCFAGGVAGAATGFVTGALVDLHPLLSQGGGDINPLPAFPIWIGCAVGLAAGITWAAGLFGRDQIKLFGVSLVLAFPVTAVALIPVVAGGFDALPRVGLLYRLDGGGLRVFLTDLWPLLLAIALVSTVATAAVVRRSRSTNGRAASPGMGEGGAEPRAAAGRRDDRYQALDSDRLRRQVPELFAGTWVAVAAAVTWGNALVTTVGDTTPLRIGMLVVATAATSAAAVGVARGHRRLVMLALAVLAFAPSWHTFSREPLWVSLLSNAVCLVAAIAIASSASSGRRARNHLAG